MYSESVCMLLPIEDEDHSWRISFIIILIILCSILFLPLLFPCSLYLQLTQWKDYCFSQYSWHCCWSISSQPVLSVFLVFPLNLLIKLLLLIMWLGILLPVSMEVILQSATRRHWDHLILVICAFLLTVTLLVSSLSLSLPPSLFLPLSSSLPPPL